MADELMQAGIFESMSWWNTAPAKSFLPAPYCSISADGLGAMINQEPLDYSSFQPLSFDASAWINPQDMMTHGGEDYGMFCNSGSSSPPLNSSGTDSSTVTSMFPSALLNGEHEMLNSQWNTNQREELIIDQIRATLLGASPAPSLPSSPKPQSRKTTGLKAKKKKKDESCDSGESSVKRQRIETPSSLPTFKVRKEKLGDRITALQQLVSPFGKTDTASVLHEAIEYIKFLHDQVNALSTPYMKNGAPVQHHHQHQQSEVAGRKEDLESKGLCLVPISSTFPVAHETTADFWTPTFGATFK